MAVAESGTVGRAAIRLGISQPAVSKQLQRLQRDMGVTLFLRDGREVRLTPAGRALLIDAQRLLDEAAAVVARTQRIERGESTRIVVAFVAGTIQLATDLLQAARARHDLNVQLLRVDWTDQTSPLFENRADLSLVRLPLDRHDVAHEVLQSEPRIAGFAATHPFANRAQISLRDVEDEPIINTTNQTDYWTVSPRPSGRKPVLGPLADTVEEMLAIVASGAAMCITPASIARAYPHPSVRWIDVTDLEPCFAAIAWRPQSTSALTNAVIDLAREVANGYC